MKYTHGRERSEHRLRRLREIEQNEQLVGRAVQEVARIRHESVQLAARGELSGPGVEWLLGELAALSGELEE